MVTVAWFLSWSNRGDKTEIDKTRFNLQSSSYREAETDYISLLEMQFTTYRCLVATTPPHPYLILEPEVFYQA